MSVVVLAADARAGAIDLQWQPARVVVTPGETVNLRLMAVSQDEIDDPIAVMDVIFLWDPAYVSLLGVLNDGPYTWLSSGFPFNAPGGFNIDLTDGDALYTARSQFPPAPRAAATSNGLHVTTIQFEALAETPATHVPIMAEHSGEETIVVSSIPGLDVSDNLGSAEIVITHCDLFDADADGDTDLRDYAQLQICQTIDPQSPEAVPCLCTFDDDRSGLIDEPDYTPFANAVTGPAG